MKNFTGFEWLLIDAANQFGKDKELFEARIAFMRENLHRLEEMIEECDTKEFPLFVKAVMAIRKAQNKQPTGHMVGVDASCSGIQIMSALTGCVSGASATGLVEPEKRADAYTENTTILNRIMREELGIKGVEIDRKDAKKALMTRFYGSKRSPEEVFGKGTPALAAFYKAATELAPGPDELLGILLGSWNSYALTHDWQLPDGFESRVKVMQPVEYRIEVDELDHASMTHLTYENKGSRHGLSNAANVVHSVDGFVLREMQRRCNYDKQVIEAALEALSAEAIERTQGRVMADEIECERTGYYIDQYIRSTMVSAVILPHLTEESVRALDDQHIEQLIAICERMLAHKSFPVVTVHDEFKAHPNNINQVCHHYREILAELAESDLVSDLIRQVSGDDSFEFQKLSFNLPEQIRNSNYALC